MTRCKCVVVTVGGWKVVGLVLFDWITCTDEALCADKNVDKTGKKEITSPSLKLTFSSNIDPCALMRLFSLYT